jgi:hypothetical protein
MANLGGVFDANSVAPREEFTALDPGDYPVAIVASNVEDNAKKDGSFLKLELEVIDGPCKGRKLFDRLNLNNPNAQAVEIAKATLSAICHSVGKLTVSDSNELHNKPMLAVVRKVPMKKQGQVVEGAFSNEVATYKPIGGGGQQTSGPLAAGATSSGAASPAPASGGLPWKRG